MPKDKLSYLGNCIRQARNDCNLTQQDLADQSHVAIKTIQMIENLRQNIRGTFHNNNASIEYAILLNYYCD